MFRNTVPILLAFPYPCMRSGDFSGTTAPISVIEVLALADACDTIPPNLSFRRVPKGSAHGSLPLKWRLRKLKLT